MMSCPICGKLISPAAKICPNCGQLDPISGDNLFQIIVMGVIILIILANGGCPQ